MDSESGQTSHIRAYAEIFGRSDPLPLKLLSHDKESIRRGHTVFIDVDYEKLMVNKKNAIRQTEMIAELLDTVSFGGDQDIIQISSSHYIAVGCDLKNLRKLDDVLRNTILPSSECSVLFLAEVSLTYMDVDSASAVLSWASRLTSGTPMHSQSVSSALISWLTLACGDMQMPNFVFWSNYPLTDPNIHLQIR